MSSYEISLEAKKIVKEIMESEVLVKRNDADIFQLIFEPTNQSTFQKIFSKYLKSNGE